MHSYAKFSGTQLPHIIGLDQSNGIRKADGKPGHLSYGPYIDLAAGDYTAGFYVRRCGKFDAGFVEIEAYCATGETQFAHRKIAAQHIMQDIHGLLKLDFALHRDFQAVEIRLYVSENLIIEIRDLVIFRRPQKIQAR
ncbi:hypothetical protein PY365_03915 [Roseiarcaceae bacterium H3SJ34-1]|uniref:hypothetical protein n=1 Tax=Terripilifer ovatus TaxID=3032367 RepID=UPI003AB9797A|nr:hypothetical protein [Roseiarcaceae bacterium H3SJ34-1]